MVNSDCWQNLGSSWRESEEMPEDSAAKSINSFPWNTFDIWTKYTFDTCPKYTFDIYTKYTFDIYTKYISDIFLCKIMPELVLAESVY